jgi:hypothetical protein
MLSTTRRQLIGLGVLLILSTITVTLHFTHHRDLVTPLASVTILLCMVFIIQVLRNRKR